MCQLQKPTYFSTIVICCLCTIGILTLNVFTSHEDNSTNSVYQLNLVQVFTRHGDRTPAHIIPNINVEWKCDYPNMIYYSSSNPNIEGGIYSKVYIKGKQQLLGNCALGQLTEIGIQQHLELGKKFRKKYVEEMKFLSENANNEELFIESTNFQRTIRSAISQMEGLYPPGNGRPMIPLHSSEKEVSDL